MGKDVRRGLEEDLELS